MVGTLHDTHVLVVGGTGRLGRAIAETAVAEGARVTVTSRSAEAAAALADELGPGARGVAYDLTDHETIPGLVDAGPFDHVVLTAADLTFRSLTDVSREALHALVETKLLGTMWTCRHLRDHVADDGSMLLIGGMLSRRPVQAAPLAAVNGAIESLGRALAHEYAPLRVNVVSPGAVGASGLSDHDGTAGDVAQLVVAVLANRWVNGDVIDIHGG